MYLTQALHRSVHNNPAGEAAIAGDRIRTFDSLHERVARFAGALKAVGVEAGDRVAILSLNSDRYIEYLFAVPWAGGVLNPVNIRWSPAEIAYSLDDSGSAVLLVDDMFAKMLPALRGRSTALRTVIHCGDGPTPDGALSYEELLAAAEPVADARRSGDDLAGVFYTGGTTGRPKGVMLSHSNLVSAGLGGLVSGTLFRHGEQPRVLHAAPMFHLADFMLLVMTNIFGGTNVTMPAFDPQQTIAAIEKYRITETLLVPTMIQMLVSQPGIADADLGSLRTVLYGASPMPDALLVRAKQALPHTDFVQAYGMTESSGLGTILSAADHGDPVRRRSGGRPSVSSEIVIVGPDGAELPAGEVGEITVRGSQVMRGYWNKPEETTAVLRDGWLHTGDAGYMDDEGYVFIVDRLKDMIISGGENVYSAEVENAVSRHPAVAVCAVIGIPDERWGERVHAVVVRKPGATVTADEIRATAHELIAGYKCPRSVEFADSLPVSGAGKILKRELRDRAVVAVPGS
ncbi:long-chain-fatty-acid--CoA ligase [Streptomyces sp. NPDC002324]